MVGAAPMADRLFDLYRSLPRHKLQSEGVEEELAALLPGGPETLAGMEEGRLAQVVFDVVNALRWRQLEPVLKLHDIPHPQYPIGLIEPRDKPPAVPVWQQPRVEPSLRRWRLLGRDVGFPIGIPSCELTRDADWIEHYARKGFHVLTYRTVRNEETPGSAYDWVFLAGFDQPWASAPESGEVRSSGEEVPRDWRSVTTATSFLAPCPSPDIWQADMLDARKRLDRLGDRHLLIASVTDCVERRSKSPETLAADFVKVATRAEAAGAQAIECYLARAAASIDPETGRREPCDHNAETSIAIVEAVRAALQPGTSLVIKLGADLDEAQLADVVVPLAERRLIDGVSGISPARVDRVQGTGWGAKPPGVAGWALREISREFVKRLSRLKADHGLPFDILAMGGVATAADVSEYLALGASAVQAASASANDPGLAADAALHYLPSVQKTEQWDGVVGKMDPDGHSFWARLVSLDDREPDLELRFELSEVHPTERDRFRPGQVFTWRTDVVAEGGELVRLSSLRLRAVAPLTENEHLEGKRIARRVMDRSSTLPEAPLG